MVFCGGIFKLSRNLFLFLGFDRTLWNFGEGFCDPLDIEIPRGWRWDWGVFEPPLLGGVKLEKGAPVVKFGPPSGIFS